MSASRDRQSTRQSRWIALNAHQILEDLETSTTIYRAYRVLNEEMVERSNNSCRQASAATTTTA